MALNRDLSSRIRAAVITIIIAGVSLSVTGRAYSGSGASLLSPPLLTKPSYELSRKESNEKWAFADMSIIIGRALKAQISKHTLIPMITGHIKKRGPVGRALLQGFDIKGMEEVRTAGLIREFSIPVRRTDGSVERLIYSLTSGGIEEEAIPIDENACVYIKKEKIPAPEEAMSAAPKSDPDPAQMSAAIFYDLIRRIQARDDARPVIIALGTTWIKGYEHDSFPQYNALNPLLSHIRLFCSSRNVLLLIKKDKELIKAIRLEKAKETNREAKVIVLAGVSSVASKDFETLRQDASVFMAGVNNRYLTVDSYTRLIEILTLTLELAFNLDDAIRIPEIKVKKHRLFPSVYILFPFVCPLDYEDLRNIYRLQAAA
ncbi:MAG: hypothetical protein WC779_00785 [Candidatus Omnitrophota bacterium]|jgi:hypothetical protein